MNTSILFFVTGLMTALIPGPDITFITKCTLSRGIKHGIIASTGILTGLLIYLSISASGISFIGENKTFQIITSFFGIIYLTYISITLWKENSQFDNLSQKNKNSFLKTYISALFVHISNPKAIFFFGILLTPFLKEKNVLIHSIYLYIGFILSFYTYTILLAKIGKNIKPNTLNLINKIISIFFFLFSLKLIYSTFFIICKTYGVGPLYVYNFS
ncbi:MAG: LysE family translocator [Candidatus Muirbacterium halophilum]|nr:LysE family translocator [Candidatus Muirbacterium halophilum]MCK9476479.1 LysE family translocator [Candidatus Muirbacterium halophilum]